MNYPFPAVLLPPQKMHTRVIQHNSAQKKSVFITRTRNRFFHLAVLILLCITVFRSSQSVSAAEAHAKNRVRFAVPLIYDDAGNQILSFSFEKGSSVSDGTVTAWTKISPDKKVIDSESNCILYSFSNLQEGVLYRYTVKGTGYYKVVRMFAYTEAKNELTHPELEPVYASTDKMAGTGYEASTVYHYTEEVEDSLLSVPEGYDSSFFNTPAFSDEKASEEYTTNEELEAYLQAFAAICDYAWLYTAGQSTHGTNIYIMLITSVDLSACSSYEEAAAMLEADRAQTQKPTIMCTGQVHGEENAGGEAILRLVGLVCGDTTGTDKYDDLADRVLENVNLCLIPRVNPDAAEQFVAYTDHVSNNRSHFNLRSKETIIQHEIYQAFLPEIVIDCHEFSYQSKNTARVSGVLDDVNLAAADNLNSDTSQGGVNDTAYAMLLQAVEHLQSIGLRPAIYADGTSTTNATTGRTFYGLCGSLSFLMETPGDYNTPKSMLNRRLVTQLETALCYINYACDNGPEITRMVSEARQTLIEQGRVYGEEDDLIVLNATVSSSDTSIFRPIVNLLSGDLSEGSQIVYRLTSRIEGRYRTRPTAYLLAADGNCTDYALELLQKQGITYEFLEGPVKFAVRNYKGNGLFAVLQDECAVTFQNGVYIFTMDQPFANILALTMEPDVSGNLNTSNGTCYPGSLVQQGVADCQEIYRYEYDLIYDAASETWKTSPIVELNQCTVSMAYNSHSYTGNALQPTVTIAFEDRILKENVDYILQYTNCTEPGTAYVTVKGIGNCEGYQTLSYQITKAPQSILLEKQDYSGFYGNDLTLSAETTGDGDLCFFSTNRDVVSVLDSKTGEIHLNAAGKAVIYVYAQSTDHFDPAPVKRILIKVSPIDLTQCTVSLEYDYHSYTGAVLQPAVKVFFEDQILKEGTDYTLKYTTDCIEPGTVSVTVSTIGSCTGNRTLFYQITKKSQSILLEKQSCSGVKGSTLTLSAETTGDGDFFFVSTDNDIISVLDHKSGEIQLNAAGTASVFVYAQSSKHFNQSPAKEIIISVR